MKLICAEMMQAGTIDVDPEYQRDVVWTGELLYKVRQILFTNLALQLTG